MTAQLAAPAELHQFALSCATTAAQQLRLWADRPCVLQGSPAAAARLTTAVVQGYIHFPWTGDSRAKVRRNVLPPGFLSAYTAACEALAAALETASAENLEADIAEMTAVLLWVWQAAMEMFDDGAALEDSTMYSLVLPVVQLAGAALRCWSGPAAVHISKGKQAEQGSFTARAVGEPLSRALLGSQIPDLQLLAALQQPSSAAALESSIRCWAHQLTIDPASLTPPQQRWPLLQGLGSVVVANLAWATAMQISSIDAENLHGFKLLMAKLQAATSNAEEDDVAAMQELDKMRTCMTVALIVPVSKGLTYEAAPAEVHRMAVNASITAAHLLRLWADRPCVLQGSSAAARLTTAVVRHHISFPWEGESRTKVRRYALTPGFVSAYSTACEALAAALDKARAADVPQHIAEMAAMLLGVWQAAVAMFDDAGALEDSTMFSLVLPVVQLAGAGGWYCC
ncbi:hypothetical protein OEZ85_003657 [Tetradesmus obliquus]|uniref:Uncharacterized protein n=1 Tax=Tetradesmus obliquus TaxID=3088 RepID=A0ABY8UCG8_TETOB|nr:hypothetical protein OEZ85_003657 [Tetradesmus obliquus]